MTRISPIGKSATLSVTPGFNSTLTSCSDRVSLGRASDPAAAGSVRMWQVSTTPSASKRATRVLTVASSRSPSTKKDRDARMARMLAAP